MIKRTVMTAIAIALLLSACSVNIVRGSGKLVTEKRQIRGVERVSVTGSGDVILTQGDRESLTVETDDNVMRHVITEVDGGTLTLGTKSGVSVSPTRLTFTLTVKDLEGITVSGSGNVDAARLTADRIEVKVTGSGNVRMDDLSGQELRVQITGSGNVTLAGEASEQEVTVSGSGNYKGGDLRSETTTVKTTGSGNATLWATGSLDARATGSGTIRYYGKPTMTVSSTGSGSVKGLGDK